MAPSTDTATVELFLGNDSTACNSLQGKKNSMACSADSSFLIDKIIGLLAGDQNEGPKLRTARDKEHLQTVQERVLHFNLSTFSFKMALAQKYQYFTFLEGRKDRRRNKKKGVSKGKTSNGVKLICGVLFPEGFCRQVKQTHIKRDNSERDEMTSWCSSHLQLGQEWVMNWLSDYMTGPKRSYLKHTFWSYSSIKDGSPFFITH